VAAKYYMYHRRLTFFSEGNNVCEAKRACLTVSYQAILDENMPLP